MGVVVDVGQPGAVHVHLQAALDAFEGGDGGLDGLRGNTIDRCHGCCCNAVLGIHPAGCANAEAGNNA